MKKLILFIFSLFFSISAFSQDFDILDFNFGNYKTLPGVRIKGSKLFIGVKDNSFVLYSNNSYSAVDNLAEYVFRNVDSVQFIDSNNKVICSTTNVNGGGSITKSNFIIVNPKIAFITPKIITEKYLNNEFTDIRVKYFINGDHFDFIPQIKKYSNEEKNKKYYLSVFNALKDNYFVTTLKGN